MIKVINRIVIREAKRASRRGFDAFIQEQAKAVALSASSRVLSVGAGGPVGAALRQAGLRPIEVDVDAGRQPDMVLDLSDMRAIGSESIKAVFCMEVLEHVRDLGAACREILRVLQPGGHLIGSTPFLLPIHDAPHDYWRFTSYGLRVLLADFEEVVLRERDGYFDNLRVLLLRSLFNQPRNVRRRLLVSYPGLYLAARGLGALNDLLPAQNATTGYFFVFRKPTAQKERYASS